MLPIAHNKKFSYGVVLLIVAAIFAVLVPSVASALTPDTPGEYKKYCGGVMPAPSGPQQIQCYTSGGFGDAVGLDRCTNFNNNLVTGGEALSVTVPCFKVDPTAAYTPAQQALIDGANAVIDKRDAAAASSIFPSWLPDWMLWPFAGIAWIIFKIAGFFLVSMAKIMDLSIQMTTDSALLGGLQFVDIGWTAVRDISNMFFIFALLYIAIQTVLGLAGSGAKKWVAHIIIAAILINFSMFFTKVVIDAGNVFAVSFWNKISTEEGAGTDGASPKILAGLNLQTVFDKENVGEMDNGPKMLIYGGGAVFMFIAGYILLAAALMMATRTISLILLMIFSPFAFMCFGIPKLEGYGHDWLGKLIKQTFVAPIFIFMLYLNSVMVDKMDIFKLSSSEGATFSNALTGGSDFAVIFNFILMIGFLLASLAIANKYAGEVGSGARGFAKSATRWAGGAVAGGTFAAGGLAGRELFGRYGKNRQNNEEWQKKQRQLVAKGSMDGATIGDKYNARMANLKLAGAQKLAKGTYDIRNAPMGGLGTKALLGTAGVNAGTGSKKSYDSHGSAVGALTGDYRGTENEKNLIATAKDRYPTDPAAQRAFLTQRGVDMDAKRNKELSDQLKRETQKKDNIKAAEDHLKKVSGDKGFTDFAKMTPEEAAKLNKDIQETVSKMAEADAKVFMKGFSDALGKLSGKEYAEMGENFLKLDIVQRGANGTHVAEVQTKLSDGTLTIADPNGYRESLSGNIAERGTPSAQMYMKNQLKQGNTNFIFDKEKNLSAAKSIADPYDREDAIRNALGYMTIEEVAAKKDDELVELGPYLNDSHYKGMGKRKEEQIKAVIKEKNDKIKQAKAEAEKIAAEAKEGVAKAAKAAADATAKSARYQELFAKLNRTQAEEEELKSLST